MKKYLFTPLSLLILSPATFAFMTKNLEVKVSSQWVGKVDMELNINGKLVQKISPASSIETISLSNPTKINFIDYRIKLNSDINVGKDNLKTALIEGKWSIVAPKNSFKSANDSKHNVTISSTEKLKLDISCSKAISVSSPSPQVLSLSLENFKNLSSCQGKDIPEYSIDKVANRGVGEGPNKYTLKDDFQLGKEFADDFNKKNEDKLLPVDHPMTRFMQKQMEEIARVSDRPDINPVVRVINADVVNAFALPGGYVYVFRGLLEKSPSYNSVIGVLGHEWAHVTSRHGTRGVTRARRVLTAAVITGAAGAIAAEIFVNTKDDQGKVDEKKKQLKEVLQTLSLGVSLGGARLFILDRGREQELEADRLGSQYALRAGFSPIGIGEFFTELSKGRPAGVWLDEILSTHPDHATRIERNYIQSALFLPSQTSPDSPSVKDGEKKISYRVAFDELQKLRPIGEAKSKEVANSLLSTLSAVNESRILEANAEDK